MHSIIIMGNRAPEDCHDCELSEMFYNIENKGAACKANWTDGRPPGCPIIEIETRTSEEIEMMIAHWGKEDSNGGER